jgi:hypothetical protein
MRFDHTLQFTMVPVHTFLLLAFMLAMTRTPAVDASAAFGCSNWYDLTLKFFPHPMTCASSALVDI